MHVVRLLEPSMHVLVVFGGAPEGSTMPYALRWTREQCTGRGAVIHERTLIFSKYPWIYGRTIDKHNQVNFRGKSFNCKGFIYNIFLPTDLFIVGQEHCGCLMAVVLRSLQFVHVWYLRNVCTRSMSRNAMLKYCCALKLRRKTALGSMRLCSAHWTCLSNGYKPNLVGS